MSDFEQPKHTTVVLSRLRQEEACDKMGLSEMQAEFESLTNLLGRVTAEYADRRETIAVISARIDVVRARLIDMDERTKVAC